MRASDTQCTKTFLAMGNEAKILLQLLLIMIIIKTRYSRIIKNKWILSPFFEMSRNNVLNLLSFREGNYPYPREYVTKISKIFNVLKLL